LVHYEFLKFASQQEVIAARWAIPPEQLLEQAIPEEAQKGTSRSIGIPVCLIQDYLA
jgi:hypothetical protein